MPPAVLNWLRATWDLVRTSLWALPGLMFLFGAVLAVAMLRADELWPASIDGGHWISSGDGEDARSLLSTLLTGVIAMASIVFSITVVALSLAANTYGPRLIRIFRSNPRTKIVLGIFSMTIVYLLLVLHALRGSASPEDVPALAVAGGSLLSLVCVLALLAFIQGMAALMVSDEVVRRVRKEFDSVLKELPPLDRPGPATEAILPADFERSAARIPLPREGYVQSVEYSEIVEWAKRNDAIVRLDFKAGDFVVDGDRKVLILPAPDDSAQARKEIDRLIVSGQRRTPTQDLEFSIRHLVEVAVRALSPGINDPFTAVAVIDRLRGGLARLANKQLSPPALPDDEGKLRLVRHVTTFSGAVDASFNQIRQAGAAKPAVLISILKAIGALAEHLRMPEQRDVLARHASLAVAAARREVSEPRDVEDVEHAFAEAVEALERACGGTIR